MNLQERHVRVSEIFLSALQHRTEERKDFLLEACEGDLEMLVEIEKMLVAHQSSNPLLDKPLEQNLTLSDLQTNNVVSQTLIGQKIGKYSLIREIGQGGMGLVYEAIREDLPKSKPVAIKVIKLNLGTEAILARFRVEYQIMANLEHSYIARLLDGGEDNGISYFVMELVNGLALDEYCQTRKLEIKEKLQLFIKICSAVQYAHLNLVVHRDLKPSNILVTFDGTPKLLDFGIAKIIKNEGAYEYTKLTQTGLRVMTPAYASPEQFLGQKITIGSDVYTLGIILYQLLTNTLPYEFKDNSPKEIEKAICEQTPIKPSIKVKQVKVLSDREQNRSFAKEQRRLLKTLTGDLDNIVLMALRKEPNRRYSSVENFALDIQRYLDGYPVVARRDTLKYRISKFIKRNKVLLTTISLVVILILAGSLSTFWQATLTREEKTRVEAQSQLVAARSKDIRNLTNALLFKYNDELEKLSGATLLREQMISESVKYLDQLSLQPNFDLELQTELALAYRRVGDIQGRPFRINVGNTSAALKSYKKSLGIFERLNQQIDNTKVQFELAIALERMGETSFKTGNITESLNYYNKAIFICRKFEKDSSLKLEVKYFLGSCYVKIADVWQLKGDFANTFQFFCSALDIFTQLAEKEPKDQKFRRGLAVVYTRLIIILESSSDLLKERNPQSVLIKEFNQKSLYYSNLITENAKNALNLEPDNPFLQSELAGSYLLNGSSLSKIGQEDKAIILLETAIEILEKLTETDPSNTEYKFQLGLGYYRLGEAVSKQVGQSKAISFCQKAISILEPLSKADINNNIFQTYLAYTYNVLAMLSINKTSYRNTENNLRKAFTYWQDLSIKNPTTTSFQIETLRSLKRLIGFLSNRGHAEEVTKLSKKVVKFYEEKILRNNISDIELSDYAWFLLTHEPEALQDKERAIKYIEQASQNGRGKNLPVLLTLLSFNSLNVYKRMEQSSLETNVRRIVNCDKF